jgi:hypothetical protein
MSNTSTIDLNQARTSSQAKVFAGRERGKYWREKFKIDELDKLPGTVEVIVPADVISLNISFFLNLFGESVRKLGREEFIKHYHFNSDPILEPLIAQGIEQALKRSNALPESD